jgi:hypothetical protein
MDKEKGKEKRKKASKKEKRNKEKRMCQLTSVTLCSLFWIS